MYQQHEILKRYMSGQLSRAEELEALWPQRDDSSRLLVACTPRDYSASAIAKAVEDCDAQLEGLSVTGMRDAAGRLVVALSVGSASPEGVTRSLERYGYEVILASGQSTPSELSRNQERLNELMHYLEL